MQQQQPDGAEVHLLDGSVAAAAEESGKDPSLEPMASSWLSSRLAGAKTGFALGWQAFAETMDDIFVPESADRTGTETAQAPPPQGAGYGGQQGQPQPGQQHTGSDAPSAMSVPQDVPIMFRQPTCVEVKELLEQEGLPAYVGIPARGGFAAKKLCLDTSDSPSLYVLEPDSSVPAVFFGMDGFSLGELQRVVVGATPEHPMVKPLLSLEFEQGFLPVRLGDAMVLRGLVGLLCEGRSDVQVMQRPDWV